MIQLFPLQLWINSYESCLEGKIRLKIDLVSHPYCAEGLGNIYSHLQMNYQQHQNLNNADNTGSLDSLSLSLSRLPFLSYCQVL